MKILDRYIIRSYLSTFLFLLGAVIVICVALDFNEKLDKFLEKKIPAREILFSYYAYFIPFWANLLAPVCIFLAVIFFTSRMAQRSELIPALSAGVSFYRILAPYIATSLFLALISFLLKAYVVPVATDNQMKFEYKYMSEVKRKKSSSRNIHKKIATDSYISINYYSEKQFEGHGILLERKQGSDIVTRMKADRMIWNDSTKKWRLVRVQVREFPGKLSQRLYELPELDTTFVLTPDDLFIKEMKAASLTLPALNEYIHLEEMRGSDILDELYTERYRRYSDPVAVLILTLIGFAMSSRKSRGGIALQIGLGLLLCFIYVALLFLGDAVKGENANVFWAVWLPNFIFMPLSFLLLWWAPK